MEKQTTHVLQLTINGKTYNWHHQYITGKQIKELALLNEDVPLFLIIETPWENELINNDTRVNLARPGIEGFVTRDKHHHTVILTIETPKGKWEHAAFDKAITVQQVIDKVVKKFDFEPDGNYKLKVKGQHHSLDPHITLEQACLPDHTTLVFTDLGKGAFA